jgi:hypothetical protein
VTTLFVLLALAAAPSAHCPKVGLALAEKQIPATFRGKPFRQTSANFAKAYAKACSEGLLKTKALLSGNDKRLFLSNTPNANVASIYTIHGRTILEYSFVSEDRKTHVPSMDELHEAIFCAAHGASAREQVESGRCLPD